MRSEHSGTPFFRQLQQRLWTRLTKISNYIPI